MLTSDEIDGLQTATEALFVDTAVILRHGTPTFNPVDGTETPSTTTVYAGPCQLRLGGSQENTVIFGGEDVTVRRFVVAVPHDAVDIEIEDRITVTSTHDETTVTREFRVVSIPSRTFNLYRAISCEVVE